MNSSWSRNLCLMRKTNSSTSFNFMTIRVGISAWIWSKFCCYERLIFFCQNWCIQGHNSYSILSWTSRWRFLKVFKDNEDKKWTLKVRTIFINSKPASSRSQQSHNSYVAQIIEYACISRTLSCILKVTGRILTMQISESPPKKL